MFEELQDRRPIEIDPTLVRAAQLADIHLLNEAKERGKDLKFLVQMYFGLEEGFNKLLQSRVLSAVFLIRPQLSQPTLNKILNPLY